MDLRPGRQQDFALGKNGLQVNQNRSDARHLLQETHHHGDDDWPVDHGRGQLGPRESALHADTALHRDTYMYVW